jgi:hypothetical protein
MEKSSVATLELGSSELTKVEVTLMTKVDLTEREDEETEEGTSESVPELDRKKIQFGLAKGKLTGTDSGQRKKFN